MAAVQVLNTVQLVELNGTGGHAAYHIPCDVNFVAIGSAANPMFVATAPLVVTLADAGTLTITLGGTAQPLLASNVNRKYVYLQNLSTADLWYRFTGTAAAVQPSRKLMANQIVEMSGEVSQQAISIFGATTGQAFSCQEGT